MVDGREPVDGQESEPAQDLSFAAPVSPTSSTSPTSGTSPTSSTQPQATYVAPGSAGPASPTYQVPPPYAPYMPPGPPAAPNNPQATASLVLGIVSVLLSLLFVPAVIGVVLGIVGLVRSGRTDPPVGRGAAITGIVLSVIGAALGVVIALTASSALSDLAETIADESRSTAAEDGDGSADPFREDAPAFDPDDFDPVDAAQWESITKSPDRAEGRAVVVFAEVIRFDSSTGPDRFLAIAGVDQPADPSELRAGSVFIGDESLLDGVETDDVLRIHAVVTGSMELETQLGGISVVPALTIAQVEDVGFANLSKDFVFGSAEVDQLGILTLPVAVTNSGQETFTYSAKVVAESKDGKTTYDDGTVFIENIEPGKKVQVGVDFFDEVPADAVFRVAESERYIE